MPIRQPLLLWGLLLLAPWAAANERLSLQIAGGYTEVEGFIDFDLTLTPTLVNPFDPDRVLTVPPRGGRDSLSGGGR